MPCSVHCYAAHGASTGVKIAKSISCSGHRAQKPLGDLSLPTFDLNVVRGAVVKQQDVKDLRDRIAAELNARYQHATYSTAAISSLRTQMQSTPSAGSKVLASDNNQVNTAVQRIGTTTYEAGILRPSPGTVINNEGEVPEDTYTLVANESPKMVSRSASIPRDVSAIQEAPTTKTNDLGADGGVLSYPTNTGDKITVESLKRLKDNYIQLSKDCICHADCACNAVCACHNNCGCNY